MIKYNILRLLKTPLHKKQLKSHSVKHRLLANSEPPTSNSEATNLSIKLPSRHNFIPNRERRQSSMPKKKRTLENLILNLVTLLGHFRLSLRSHIDRKQANRNSALLNKTQWLSGKLILYWGTTTILANIRLHMRSHSKGLRAKWGNKKVRDRRSRGVMYKRSK